MMGKKKSRLGSMWNEPWKPGVPDGLSEAGRPIDSRTSGGQPELRNLHLRGESFVCGHPQLTTHIESCLFEQCEVTITCPGMGLILGDCTFRDSTIRARRLANYQFFDVVFEGCTFLGRFPGCEFGYRPWEGSLPVKQKGYIRSCDFSAAQLDLVAIHSSDVATLKLPPWPHFAVLSPRPFSTVPELAADPEWQILAKLPWNVECSAIVLRYRTGGRHGFSLPEAEALSILRAHSDVAITT